MKQEITKLTGYPKYTKFKYSWRKYQQRVLDDLQNHLTDDHLHVVAPPGSGKTVLGLEVAIRLNNPTLILAPTIAIRNQWIQRFCELFLQTTKTPDWISRDIRNPTFLTVVTYQGLHAACNDLHEHEATANNDVNETNIVSAENRNFKKIVDGLKSKHIKTIIVDEAHHLKNEWWNTLTKIKEKINPIIVGLTATPPYDVTAAEWFRYLNLNGPVDTEISVPELVIEGDLCPHQDYVYFTLPTDNEKQSLVEFRKNSEKIFQEISHDDIILQAIQSHPIWRNPTEQLDWIYHNLPYYSACLIYLNANDIAISETHIEIIGDKKIRIPKLDFEWMETLIDFYLYREKEHFKAFEEHQKSLENRLRRKGIIDRRQIGLVSNRCMTGSLTSSISKLNGIKEIVDFEYEQLGKDLRLVILSDYIRQEFLTDAVQNDLVLNKMGVIPIFEKLRRENRAYSKIAVLTGSLIIIPASALAAFKEKSQAFGIDKINYRVVSYDSNYIVIEQTVQLKNDIVHIITQIFQNGEIEVLIGTKSLLGEGWDAPAINSLILASFVGSFVLSNQMRGRAIRTHKGNHSKTGNIWHLACVDPTSQTGGADFELLKRRFRSFVGVSLKEEPTIENGIGRLNLPGDIHLADEVEKINSEMFSFAQDRQNLKERWEAALATGVNLVEEIKIPFLEEKEYKVMKSFYLTKTIANLMATLGFGLSGFFDAMLQGLGRARIRSSTELYIFLGVIAIVGVLFFGRLTIRTLRLYLKLT